MNRFEARARRLEDRARRRVGRLGVEFDALDDELDGAGPGIRREEPILDGARPVSPGTRSGGAPREVSRWIPAGGFLGVSGSSGASGDSGTSGASGEEDRESPSGALGSRLTAAWRLFFVGIWLVYLVPTLRTAAGADPLAVRVVGVVAVVGFGVLYLGSFAAIRRLRRSDRPALRRLRLALVAGATALALVALPAAGEQTLAMCVYLAVVAMFLLPSRAGALFVLADAAVVALASRFVPGWHSQYLLSLQILVTGLAIWGILQLIRRNRQLARAREEITGLAVAQERLRFSRDLHDILGHSLTVITLKAELAGRLVTADPERAEREIAEVERLARTALADVRATAAGYRHLSLAGELASARAALDTAGIEADLPTAVDEVPADRVELFGWAVREGVTNVVRHSGARHCRVVVDQDAIEICDDGAGPPADVRGTRGGSGLTGSGLTGSGLTGSGLNGLRERAEAAGARLTTGPAEGGGFTLRVGW